MDKCNDFIEKTERNLNILRGLGDVSTLERYITECIDLIECRLSCFYFTDDEYWFIRQKINYEIIKLKDSRPFLSQRLDKYKKSISYFLYEIDECARIYFDDCIKNRPRKKSLFLCNNKLNIGDIYKSICNDNFDPEFYSSYQINVISDYCTKKSNLRSREKTLINEKRKNKIFLYSFISIILLIILMFVISVK